MFRRFLSGFATVFPFVCFTKYDLRMFPREIYRNDWKIIGDNMRDIINKKI